jgi:hypothetical protein
MPASRAGAFAWHPPIFLSPDPSRNVPASAWAPSSPFLPNPFGQFPPAATALPDLPPGGIRAGIERMLAEQAEANDPLQRLAQSSILGDIPKLLAASNATNPWGSAPKSLLDGITNLSTASAPTAIPSIDPTRGPFAPWPSPFSGPLPPGSGVGDQYPQLPLPGYLAGPAPAPLSQSADTSESSTFNTSGILPPDLSGTPLSTAAAVSPAGGDSVLSADSSPFWRFLNALSPVSPANAAEDEGGGLPPVLLELLLHGLTDAATAKRLAEQQKILQDAEEARRIFLSSFKDGLHQGLSEQPLKDQASRAQQATRPTTSSPAMLTARSPQQTSFRNSKSASMTPRTECFFRRTEQPRSLPERPFIPLCIQTSTMTL